MNEVIRLSACALCVEFWRESDRFRHQIAMSTPDGLRPWLASVEGVADNPWPPSPPFQELHLEQRPGDKQVALLVGRAGRAHWSLSVEADDSRETLLFDVACRSRCTAEQLHSSYRFVDDRRPDVEPVSLSCYELCLLEGELHFDRDAGAGVSIGPQRGAYDATVQTFRWRYQIGRALALPCPDDL